MLELRGPVTRHPFFAEGGVPQRVAEGRAALIDDLLAVSDEEKPAAR